MNAMVIVGKEAEVVNVVGVVAEEEEIVNVVGVVAEEEEIVNVVGEVAEEEEIVNVVGVVAEEENEELPPQGCHCLACESHLLGPGWNDLHCLSPPSHSHMLVHEERGCVLLYSSIGNLACCHGDDACDKW